MPEGDTIYLSARRLKVLEGARIESASSPRQALDCLSLTERSIERVESRGKHLLMILDDESVIHSHMGMTGSWHLYRSNEAWRKPRRFAALILSTTDFDSVCFTPKTIEHLDRRSYLRHRHLSRLGPDLLTTEPFPMEEAVRRFRVHNASPIGVALVNQTIVSGIGNVYKSELLFLMGLNPWGTVKELDDALLKRSLNRVAELMRENLHGRRRQTRRRTDGPGYWVYGREGERCLKCGTRIEMKRQGDAGRSTYWCRSCQDG